MNPSLSRWLFVSLLLMATISVQEGPVSEIDLSGTKVTDDALRLLSNLAELRTLNLRVWLIAADEQEQGQASGARLSTGRAGRDDCGRRASAGVIGDRSPRPELKVRPVASAGQTRKTAARGPDVLVLVLSELPVGRT